MTTGQGDEQMRSELEKLEGRVGAIELTLARQDERERRIEHDTKNIRQLFTSLEAKSEARHESLNTKIDSKIDGMEAKVDGKIDGLSKMLLTTGISIIGTLFLLMITIIGYFLMQKDATVESARDRRVQIEALARQVQSGQSEQAIRDQRQDAAAK